MATSPHTADSDALVELIWRTPTLKGRREPGPMLVASLGLRRVVSYVPN